MHHINIATTASASVPDGGNKLLNKKKTVPYLKYTCISLEIKKIKLKITLFLGVARMSDASVAIIRKTRPKPMKRSSHFFFFQIFFSTRILYVKNSRFPERSQVFIGTRKSFLSH